MVGEEENTGVKERAIRKRIHGLVLNHLGLCTSDHFFIFSISPAVTSAEQNSTYLGLNWNQRSLIEISPIPIGVFY